VIAERRDGPSAGGETDPARRPVGDHMHGVKAAAAFERGRDLPRRRAGGIEHDPLDPRAQIAEDRVAIGDGRIDEEEFAGAACGRAVDQVRVRHQPGNGARHRPAANAARDYRGSMARISASVAGRSRIRSTVVKVLAPAADSPPGRSVVAGGRRSGSRLRVENRAGDPSGLSSDWGEFDAWCGRGAAITLTAASATVAAYLACMATWRSPARASCREIDETWLAGRPP